MPIVGLTDKEAQLPTIAIIRKGGEKVDPKKPGADLEYFRFDPCDDADTELARRFELLFGAEPVVVRAQIPVASTDEAFPCWKEAWTGSALQHRCDGETCVRWMKPDGTYSDESKPCPGDCKQVGRLKLIIPELERLGYVVVQTTSIWDIINITENLRALEGGRGDLRGIPVIIRRQKKTISTPGGAGRPRTRREKSLLFLEADPSWVKLLAGAQRNRAIEEMTGASVAMPALLSPESHGDEDDDETQPLTIHHHPPQPTHDANGVPIRNCEKCHAIMPHGLMKKAGKWGWICTACDVKVFDTLSTELRTALMATATERGLDTSERSKANRLAQTKALLDRDVASWSDLNPREASKLIDWIGDGSFAWDTVPKEAKAPKNLTQAVSENAAAAAIDPTPDETEELYGQGGADYVPPAEEIAEGEVVEASPVADIPEHLHNLIIEAGEKGLNVEGFLTNPVVLDAINAYLEGAKQNKFRVQELIALKSTAAGLVQSAIVTGKLTW